MLRIMSKPLCLSIPYDRGRGTTEKQFQVSNTRFPEVLSLRICEPFGEGYTLESLDCIMCPKVNDSVVV